VKTCRIQFVILLLAVGAWAQSDGDVPLGDVARNIRKAKVTTKAADVRSTTTIFQGDGELGSAANAVDARHRCRLVWGR